ncbi:MAG: tetratricopeptide repeat protein [Fibrobacterota bacterium]
MTFSFPGTLALVLLCGFSAPASGPVDSGRVLLECRAFADAEAYFKRHMVNDTLDIPVQRGWQDAVLFQGDTARVVTAARVLVRDHAQDPAAHYLLGRCLPCSTGLASFDRALALNPRHAWSHNGRGACAFEQGDYPVARAFFLTALKFDPAFDEGYRNLSRTYLREKSRDKALAVYRKFIARDRNNPTAYEGVGDLYLELSRFNEALKAYRKAEVLGDSASPGLLFKAGYAAFKAGRTPLSAAYYRRSVEKGNDTYEAHFNLANALELLRLNEEALTHYRLAYEKTRDYKLLYSMGNCAVQLGLYTKAIECYQGFLEKEPGHAEALFGLANALQIKRDFDRAVETYHKVVALDKGFSKAYYNLGSIYAYHLNGPEKAREYWGEYIRLFPGADDLAFVRKEMAKLSVKQ